MAKKKKLLKKLAKAALIGGALYGGSKLLKGAKGNVLKTAASEDANIGVSHFPGSKYITKKAVPKIFDHNKVFGDVSKGDYGVGFKKGGHVKSMGIAKRGGGVAKR